MPPRSPRPSPPLLLPTLLLLLTCLPLAPARVVELTPLTLQTHITSAKPLLLEFYAPWCNHCQNFESSYHRVAHHLSPDTTVARIDGHLHKIASLRFRVRGLPSFFYISDGRVSEFHGKRSVEAMIEFVESKGMSHGKEHDFFFGPLGMYWKGVDLFLRASERAWDRFAQSGLEGWRLGGVVAAAIAALLLVFLVVIYFVTKPPAVKVRPHAD